MGIVLIILGLLHVFFPRVGWYIEMGWKLKNSEPSDGYLLFLRILGVIFCFIGMSSIFS